MFGAGAAAEPEPAPVIKTKERLARAAGVSSATAQKAITVKAHAPELHAKVVTGEMQLQAAYRAVRDGRDGTRPEFRRTQYLTVYQLFAELARMGEDLPASRWIEPCAGDGDLIEHVARARLALELPLPTSWLAIELEASPPLRALEQRGAELTTSGVVRVVDGQDFLLWGEADPSAAAVVTNWPWYGISPLVDQAFALYPNAVVIGLCCVREPLDEGRPAWFEAHAPDHFVCHGRQPFDKASAGYTHPVAWLRWPPGPGRDRREGRWRVLPFPFPD